MRANWAAFGTTVLVFIRVRDELEIKAVRTKRKIRSGRDFARARACLALPIDRLDRYFT